MSTYLQDLFPGENAWQVCFSLEQDDSPDYYILMIMYPNYIFLVHQPSYFGLVSTQTLGRAGRS